MTKPAPRSEPRPPSEPRPRKRREKDKPGSAGAPLPEPDDLGESVAGEEDPGAALEGLLDMPSAAHLPLDDDPPE